MRKIEWVVYAKRPFGGPDAVLAYLSRYTHRVAIANSWNLVAAYQGLSPTMRGFVDGLRAVHANVARATPKPGQQYNERIKRRPLASEHPLVTVHAETGERVLFASPPTSSRSSG